MPPSDQPVDEAVTAALSGRSPRAAEVENANASLVLRAMPLRSAGDWIGSLMLLRDVTELRRRERELVTKEATIREIHHRVKNNLQTVAALLRLQSRRMGTTEARLALEEANRRVAAIAVVHETLSQSFDESVDFDEVADRLRAMVVEVSSAASTGHGARMPRDVATVRVVRPAGGRAGRLAVDGAGRAVAERRRARVRRRSGLCADRRTPAAAERWRYASRTTGTGCPTTSTRPVSANLGIAIVRTLVESELHGAITFGPLAPGSDRAGTVATVTLPLPAGPGVDA